MNLIGMDLDHAFRHEVNIDSNADEVERYMVALTPGLNKRWVRVALDNGDICSVVKIGGKIAGIGWASLVNDIGRLHNLYVERQFRRTGIAQDLLYARLLWLRSRHARSLFAEIAHDNIPSLAHVAKGGMRVTGHVFQYFKEKTHG